MVAHPGQHRLVFPRANHGNQRRAGVGSLAIGNRLALVDQVGDTVVKIDRRAQAGARRRLKLFPFRLGGLVDQPRNGVKQAAATVRLGQERLRPHALHVVGQGDPGAAGGENDRDFGQRRRLAQPLDQMGAAIGRRVFVDQDDTGRHADQFGNGAVAVGKGDDAVERGQRRLDPLQLLGIGVDHHHQDLARLLALLADRRDHGRQAPKTRGTVPGRCSASPTARLSAKTSRRSSLLAMSTMVAKSAPP